MQLTVLPGGTFTIQLSAPQEARVIAEVAALRAKEEAEQAAKSKVYTLEELQDRMKMGRTSLLKYLNTPEGSGGIRHRKAGAKYLVSEQAIRDWFGDIADAD
ncbi:hypothetical protein H8B13_09025 [Hymenobacter sp. BT188]|uniref:hypothetical protein n=1 Tax=Hymenobacter sp. BT188 TaxID=2763504 RepID=UPI00165154F0|nr:hypothetical protein [Hymenobacter sp. BT188]MBC6606958.1 hypothetical protein [Hymenobacter sp. BT188]